MAVRQGSHINDADGRVLYSWTGLLNGDTGTVVAMQERVNFLSAQTVGTFGAGGSVSLQGSSDGTNWATMDDVSNTPIAMTASTKIWRIANPPKFLRPNVTAGDGTTSLTVNISGVFN